MSAPPLVIKSPEDGRFQFGVKLRQALCTSYYGHICQLSWVIPRSDVAGSYAQLSSQAAVPFMFPPVTYE